MVTLQQVQQQRQQLEQTQQQIRGQQPSFSQQQLRQTTPIQRQRFVQSFEQQRQEQLAKLQTPLEQVQQAEQQIKAGQAAQAAQQAQYGRAVRVFLGQERAGSGFKEIPLEIREQAQKQAESLERGGSFAKFEGKLIPGHEAQEIQREFEAKVISGEIQKGIYTQETGQQWYEVPQKITTDLSKAQVDISQFKEPPVSAITKVPSKFQRLKQEFSEKKLQARGLYGEFIQREPSMDPIFTSKTPSGIAKGGLIIAAETIARGIKLPRDASYVAKFAYEAPYETYDLSKITTTLPESTIPQRVTIGTVGAPSGEFMIEEQKIKALPTPTEVQKAIQLGGELVGLSVIPVPVLAAMGGSVMFAPKEAQITEQERITGGLLTFPLGAKIAGRVVGIPARRVAKAFAPFGEEIIITPSSKLIPAEVGRVSKPRVRTVDTLPTGERIIKETFDVEGVGGFIQKGRKLRITTPVRERLGMKPIYEGVPFGKVGSEQYKIALDIVQGAGYTESQAKALLRFQKPKIVPQAIEGVAEVTYVGEKKPTIRFFETEISQPVQMRIGGKPVTAGGRGEVRWLSAGGVEVGERAGYERYLSDLVSKKAFLTKDQRPFSPLYLRGRTTEQFKLGTGVKKIGEKEFGFEDPFFGPGVEVYKDISITQRIIPKSKKIDISRPGKVFVGKGEPKSIIERDSPFIVSEAKEIKYFAPKKEPSEILVTAEKGQEIKKTLESIYGKPTPAQIAEARERLVKIATPVTKPYPKPKPIISPTIPKGPVSEISMVGPFAIGEGAYYGQRVLVKGPIDEFDYLGKGDLVTKIKPIVVTPPIEGVQIPGLKEIQIIKPITGLGLMQGSELKEFEKFVVDVGTLPKEREDVKQAQEVSQIARQVPRLVPRTIIRQVPRVVPRIVPRIIPTTRPKPPKKPPTKRVPPFIPGLPKPSEEPPYIKRLKKKEDLAIPFVRRFGKFRAVSKAVTRKKALKIGTAKLRRTLAASLQLRRPSGEIIPIAPRGREFRLGKAGVGIVQRRGFRLGTTQERLEIIRSRRAGGIKLIS